MPSREKIAEALRLRKRLSDWEPLDTFIRRIAPHQPPPRHLQRLIQVIERARHREVRTCVAMPPRHGKTITLQRALAWWMLHAPADSCGYYTYNTDLAEAKSRRARDLAVQVGVPITNSNLSEWITRPGGAVLAGGVGAGLTGRGVSGFIVVDDPFKNREEADSPVMRAKVWDWFNEVVMTRLENASVIVVHTRWHEDDLIGRLVERGRWESINLPAIAEEKDALGRAPGEALWPERFPVERLTRIQRQLGEFSFAALYQGRPRPRGRAVFGPPRYYDPKTVDLNGCIAIIGADPAASERTSADYSVAVALAIRFGPKPGDLPVAYVRAVYRAQVTVPAFARALRAFQLANWKAPIAVESVGGFKAVPQLLREQAPGIMLTEIQPVTDKFLRAQSFAAAWNDGRALVPTDAPWVEEFTNELQRFTGVSDPQDDQVDAAAHAWNTATGGEPAPIRGAFAALDRWR